MDKWMDEGMAYMVEGFKFFSYIYQYCPCFAILVLLAVRVISLEYLLTYLISCIRL